MKDRTVFDTNVLVYAYDGSEPIKREHCRRLVNRIFNGDGIGVVSDQILAEFFSAATTKISRPIPRKEAADTISEYFYSTQWEKINYNAGTVLKAAITSSLHNLHFWDALIAETMKENGIDTIVTENEDDFKKIPGINVINPFKL